MKVTSLPRAVLLAPSDGALVVARSLSRHGVDVHMLVEERRSWVGSTRWATEHVVGPLPEHDDDLIAKLAALGERGVGVVISCHDRTTELVARRRAEIPACLRSFESPTSAHLRVMDKSSLREAAEEAGVRYPRTLKLSDREELDQVLSEALYPCVIKPVHSHLWRSVIGERRAIVVNDSDELRRVVTPALDAGLELLVSEHIPGADFHLEGASTIRRADGSYALICGRRKVRMHPPGYGAAAIMESADVPETVALTEAFLAATGFVGVSTSEFKLHADTGERYLIEVNVRLPQGWALGDLAGADASWRLYSTLAGLPLGPRPQQRVGVRNVIPSLELRAVPTHLAERKLNLRGVLDGYRGVRGLSGLTIRDPMPLIILGLDYVKWLLGHLRDRLAPG